MKKFILGYFGPTHWTSTSGRRGEDKKERGRLSKRWEVDIKDWLGTRLTEKGKKIMHNRAIQEICLGSHIQKDMLTLMLMKMSLYCYILN